MAKAQFHKNQRVYVKPVGTWALIERVIPHWAKGLDEPLRVYYDVGRRNSRTPICPARMPTIIGASSAPATNGSPRKIAPATPYRGPIPSW
jgi:hypothetical protein